MCLLPACCTLARTCTHPTRVWLTAVLAHCTHLLHAHTPHMPPAAHIAHPHSPRQHTCTLAAHMRAPPVPPCAHIPTPPQHQHVQLCSTRNTMRAAANTHAANCTHMRAAANTMRANPNTKSTPITHARATAVSCQHPMFLQPAPGFLIRFFNCQTHLPPKMQTAQRTKRRAAASGRRVNTPILSGFLNACQVNSHICAGDVCTNAAQLTPALVA